MSEKKVRSKVTLNQGEIETQEELREVVNTVARAMLRERYIKNVMDSELQAIREKYSTDLESLAGQIGTLTDLCADYCTRHPDLFPRGTKSLDLGQAVILFRTGTPKIKVLKRWNLKAAIEAIKARKWPQFLRQPELQLDKDAIIAARAEFPNKVLATVGLNVVQDEAFYIEPKLQPQPAGVKQEVAA